MLGNYNGQLVYFWHNKWIRDKPLREIVQGPLLTLDESFRVCDIFEGLGLWDFSKLAITLPESTHDSIKAINICTVSSQEDRLVWDILGGPTVGL